MLVVPCWIHSPDSRRNSKGDAENVNQLYVFDTFLSKNYVYTYVRFKAEDLVITEIMRFTGGILSLTKVIGVIDLSTSHVPFFVRAESIETLRKKINETKQYYVVT